MLTLREHINRLLEDGDVDYLCVLGTTAETPTLNVAEREQIIEAFVDEVRVACPYFWVAVAMIRVACVPFSKKQTLKASTGF